MRPSTIHVRRIGGLLCPADARAAERLHKIPQRAPFAVFIEENAPSPSPAEEWRPIAAFPGYEVSNRGDVRSIAVTGSRRRGIVLKTFSNSNGYRCVNLYRDGKAFSSQQVHILVARTFLGERPTEKHEVAHNDGDPRNAAVENLRWATRAENHSDKLIHDTHNRGERHGMSRLTNQQAMFVIFRYSAGWSVKRLSDEYGIAQGTIYKLLRGESWHWLPRPIKGSRKQCTATQ